METQNFVWEAQVMLFVGARAHVAVQKMLSHDPPVPSTRSCSQFA